MDWSERDRADFELALGQSFADAVSPPVPFSEASPQECCEAVRTALGTDVTPAVLAALPETGLTNLAVAFGAWFETEPPSIPQIEKAVAATLARWPS